jgi:hypothetical protein
MAVFPENAGSLSIRQIKRVFSKEKDYDYWYHEERGIANNLHHKIKIAGLQIAKNFVKFSALFPKDPKTSYLTKRKIYLECDLAYLCSKIGTSYSRMGNHELEKDAYYFKADMHKFNVEDLESKAKKDNLLSKDFKAVVYGYILDHLKR